VAGWGLLRDAMAAIGTFLSCCFHAGASQEMVVLLPGDQASYQSPSCTGCRQATPEWHDGREWPDHQRPVELAETSSWLLACLTSPAASGVPILQQVSRPEQPIIPGRREAGAVAVLVHRSACLADQRGELPERDPLIEVDPRGGRVDPLWRREIRPTGKPCVQGGLVKVLLSESAAMTAARRKHADMPRKLRVRAPVANSIMRPSVPGRPQAQGCHPKGRIRGGIVRRCRPFAS
jgi:hypothetical protein